MWWKESIIYQIYPRSFKDSNGDGIGDLAGIISKLNYLESLGIDTVWLNPVFSSPNDDNGYDISNYYDIMKEYGTMKEFDTLLEGLHERNIKLLLDLVVNHTSDEHPWFKEARLSRDSRYYNYYHWWPAEKGEPPFRFSHFDPSGRAWTYNKATDSYYLHYFSAKMPDLNWENPLVRKEVYNIMRFWIQKGVDGFRLDAICYISKDTTWPEVETHDWGAYYAHGPHLHDYLQEMNREVLEGTNITTLAEAAGITIDEALHFVEENRKELHMLYHFEGMHLGYLKDAYKRPDPKGIDLVELKRLYTSWDNIYETGGWGTIYLTNHDQPRMVSRWGSDIETYREVSAKMLITFLLTMRATPIFYNGDEIGMTNIRFENIEDYKDIDTINMYKYLQSKGEDTARFLLDQQIAARDNSRTPFQWDNSKHAGFTDGTPWIKVNDNHTFINEAAQENDERSILQFFRQVVLLRKHQPVLVYGKYELYDAAHPRVYTYTRVLDETMFLVVLNFSKETVVYTLPFLLEADVEPLVNNMLTFELHGGILTLAPYQALIFGPLPSVMPTAAAAAIKATPMPLEESGEMAI